MMSPEEEVAYTAGILDGEGSFATYLGGGKYRRSLLFAVSIWQNDKRLLEWIQERFGGKIYTKKCGSTSELRWNATDAYLFLLTVRPYLIVKDLNTDEMLRIWENRFDRQLLIELLANRKARLSGSRRD